MTRDETGRGRWTRGSSNTLVQSEEAVVLRESEEGAAAGGGRGRVRGGTADDGTRDGPIGHQQYWGLKRGWLSMDMDMEEAQSEGGMGN